MRLSSRVPLVLIWVSCSPSLLLAQQVVHATQGTLQSINASGHTMTLLMRDGSQTTFQDETKVHPDLEFDKKLSGQAVDVANFNKSGEQVVVYYFGASMNPTAVAVKDLGAQALTNTSGTVVKSERHSFSLKTSKGAEQVFQIAPTATVETPEGAVEGKDFSANKGEQLTLEYPAGDSTRSAVFIKAD